MTNFFDEITSFFTILSEDREKLLAAPVLDLQENKNIFRSDQSASGLIFSTKEKADAFAKEYQEDAREKYGILQVDKVNDLYELMQKSANQGVGSFFFSENKYKLLFANRGSEVGNILPTLLVKDHKNDLNDDSYEVLARTGSRLMKEIDIVPWMRFDITDPLTKEWGIFCPFREWETRKEMYGILFTSIKNGDNFVPVVRTCQLTSDWSSLEGLIPIFSSRSDLHVFGKQHCLNPINSYFGPFDCSKFEVFNEISWGDELKLKVLKINSITEYISEICSQIGILTMGQFVINYTGHRENMAFGWNEKCVSEKAEIYAVSGKWSISKDNSIAHLEDIKNWMNLSTINWNGGPSISLRSLSSSLSHVDLMEGFTLDEKRDEIKRIFSKDYNETDLENDEYQSKESKELLGEIDFGGIAVGGEKDKFVMKYWDTHTGDGEVISFANPFECIRFLLGPCLEEDEYIRINGCSPSGSPVTTTFGSDKIEKEKFVSKRIRHILYSFAEEIALTSYSPTGIQKICWLVNKHFDSMHVDFVGYFKDLIIQCELEDDLEELCENFAITYDAIIDYRESAELIPPPSGLAVLKKLYGEKITKDLTPKSRYFASNGLYDFSLKGESKHLDYSTISIQYVKSLEVELGSIFKLLLDSVPRDLIENIEPDRLGKDLDDYYKNGKMFSIGTMNYTLMQLKKISKSEDSLNLFNPILVHVYKLLNSSDDFSYLYYVKFINLLHRVTKKYRNGGAHDNKISLATCLECKKEILGSDINHGALARISLIRQGILAEFKKS